MQLLSSNIAPIRQGCRCRHLDSEIICTNSFASSLPCNNKKDKPNHPYEYYSEKGIPQ